MILKEICKTAKRSAGGEEDEVRGAEPREVEIKINEEKVTMVSMEMETKNFKEVRRERTNEMETKK